jgi:hypothetical protein
MTPIRVKTEPGMEKEARPSPMTATVFTHRRFETANWMGVTTPPLVYFVTR